MDSDKKFPIVKRRYLNVAVLTAFVTLPLLLGISGQGSAEPPVPWTGPVPQADCGPNDRVETGLQGQTTVAERESGASMQAYNCNLELVGQFQGEGAKWQMAWFDDCAYYGTTIDPEKVHPGTVVVDASDPRYPQASAYLHTPAMLDPHESLKVHQKRQLLAGVQEGGPGFDIYDLSADCRHPVLKASIELAGSGSDPFRAVEGHAGNFTPDGLTYYATQDFRGLRGIMPIIDVSDPSNPKHLLNWQFPGHGRSHDAFFSEDGTRMYSAQPGQFGDTGSSIGPNGLVILDVSDIQFRRPNPQIRVISTLFWEDGGQAQVALPVTYRGRPHLIFTDELGSGGVGGREGACARGLPPDGFARIIDISDETNPKTISKLMLEVSDPANCPSTVNDPTRGLGYSSHYCNVDKARNPTMLACSYYEAGLRVFDIRDPFHPREIAYYKPPAQRTAFLPGSNLYSPGADRTADGAATQVRWRKHKGETQLWFTSQDNGFQIVRFTNGIGARQTVRAEGPDAVFDDSYEDVTTTVKAVSTGSAKTMVTLRAKGFPRRAAGRTFGSHVHVAQCDEDQGGGHYQNPEAAPSASLAEKEIWLDFEVNRAGRGRATATADWLIKPGDAQSVVVHALPTDATTGAAGDRLLCTNVPFGAP